MDERSVAPPTREGTPNLGICPGWESNPPPSGAEGDTQPLSYPGQGWCPIFLC